MPYCQDPQQKAVYAPSAYGKPRSPPGYVPEIQGVSRPPKGTKLRSLGGLMPCKDQRTVCRESESKQRLRIILRKKVITHVIWDMSSRSVSSAVEFSDAFARRRTLIMSFPSCFSALSLRMSREKSSEKSKNWRSRRYSRKGR